MEPKLIPIMALKEQYATAIMNYQNALNFKKNANGEYDAYIDDEELKAVLKFFGASDISELLANPKKENVGLDTFEKEHENDTEIASEKPDTQEEKPEVTQADQDIPEEKPESEEKNTKPDIKFNKKLTFNTLGSGAQTLTTEVAADLSLASIGTPFGGLYRSLQNEKADAVRNGGRTTEIDNKLEMIEDSIIDISNLQDENNEILLTESSTTQFTYGKDGSKTGIHTWEISTFGNNAMYDKDTPQANEEDEENE